MTQSSNSQKATLDFDSIYPDAPKKPTRDDLGQTFAIPPEWVKTVLQPRDGIDMDYVHDELIPAFEALGKQNEPGKVILTGDPKKPYGRISGAHREEACKILGWRFIATLEDIALDDRQQQLKVAVSSNAGGKPMDPLELARAAHELYVGNPKTPKAEIAGLFNTSRATISKRLKLVSLITDLHPQLKSGELSLDVAAQLADFPAEEQIEMFQKFRDTGKTMATEKLQEIRHKKGYGPNRKANPAKKRATVIASLNGALNFLNKALSFESEDLQNWFNQKDARGDTYDAARSASRLVELSGEFEETFTDALGLDSQFDDIDDEEGQDTELSEKEEIDLKTFLRDIIRLKDMSSKDFAKIFEGKNPETIHQFFADEIARAEESLSVFRNRVLVSARNNKM